MKFRDRERLVREGEFIVVPHGVEHCPVRTKGSRYLIEPKSTLNTGNITTKGRRPARAHLICECSRGDLRPAMEHRFLHTRCFTNNRLAGQSARGIYDGDGLPTTRMLAIAREMNLSGNGLCAKGHE